MHVEKGHVQLYRLFDVANEVDLAGVEQLLRSRPPDPGTVEVARLQLERQRDAIVFTNPPVSATLAPRSVALLGRDWSVQVMAKVYDFGAMAVVWSFPIAAGTTLEELASLSIEMERPSVKADLERWMTEDADAAVAALSSKMEDPARESGSETLTLWAITELAGTETDVVPTNATGGSNQVPARACARALAEHPALGRLLLGEDEAFSDQLREELARSTFSYSTDDLVVIGYDQALVYDPKGTNDVGSLLEFALAQLLELEHYDSELDERVRVMHDQLHRPSGGARWRPSRFGRLRRELLAQHFEYSEVVERVGSAVKLTPDFYYATIYREAIRVFRADEVAQATQRKLDLISRTYSMLSDEVEHHTSRRLEWVVIILILIEVVLGVIDRLR